MRNLDLCSKHIGRHYIRYSIYIYIFQRQPSQWQCQSGYFRAFELNSMYTSLRCGYIKRVICTRRFLSNKMQKKKMNMNEVRAMRHIYFVFSSTIHNAMCITRITFLFAIFHSGFGFQHGSFDYDTCDGSPRIEIMCIHTYICCSSPSHTLDDIPYIKLDGCMCVYAGGPFICKMQNFSANK